MLRQVTTLGLAITGASGAPYALRLLECLVEAQVKVYLMISKPGQIVIGMETDLKLGGRPSRIQQALTERLAAAPGQISVLDRDQWTAPVASGSGVPDAMVICPCTTGTLSSVASGISRTLLERAADVILKERRRLIAVVREMPLSEIHLEHMLRLARMGAIIMPACPGFYHRPKGVSDLVDFVVARILDHLDIDQQLMPRWGLEAVQDPEADAAS
ncbi:MAG: flavin prenyltransferase UbiX [Pseudomonadota bacterium]